MNRHSLPFGVLAGVLLILSAGCTTTDRSPQGEYAMLSPHAGLDGAAAYGLWNTGGAKKNSSSWCSFPTVSRRTS